MIALDEARRIVDGFRGKTVLVIGDVMLDRYVCGPVHRISPEAPVPVVHVADEYDRLGGAANVAANVQALGGHAILAGVLGTERAADDLRHLVERHGISTAGLVTDPRVTTIVKTRIIAERQQVVRVDYEGSRDAVQPVIPPLCERAVALLPKADGILLEDYGKGVVTQELLDGVLAAAASQHKPVGLDPKDDHALRIPWLTLATPNHKEACAAAGIPEFSLNNNPTTWERLHKMGQRVREKWNCQYLMITLGAQGMYLLSRDQEPRHLPTRAREVFDVTGAGDTVIATAILGLLAGADYYRFASLANYAAGIVVGKLGTATCTREELLEAVRHGPHD